MVKIVLTDRMISGMQKPPTRTEISDTACPNLNLIVQPSGAKTWVWKGRVGGVIRKITLGSCGIHSLKAARTWANAKTAERDRGTDIWSQVREAKAEKVAAVEAATVEALRTVRHVWDAYWEKEGKHGDAAKLKEAAFNREILPAVGDRVFHAVTKRDLLAITEAKGRTHPGAANKLHAYISRLWNWATTDATGINASGTEINVYHGVKRPNKTQSGARYLSDAEITAVWQSLDTEVTAVRCLYRLLILTGARRSEIAWLERRNINLTDREIIITAENAKNGVELRIPLSPLALDIVNEALAENTGSRWLFPSESKEADTPMSGFTKFHTRVLKNSNTTGWTKHDCRRTFSTNMARLKVQQIVTECLINHVSGSRAGVAGVYNQFQYVEEMRDATTKYSEFISALVSRQSTPST